MICFKDKFVVITGASSGIGAALAKEFARRGARLLLMGRNSERLAKTAILCRSAGSPQVQTALVDMTSEESIAHFASSLKDTPDCLVLNAGISQRSPALQTEPSAERKIMETNFWGPVNLVHALSDYNLVIVRILH